MVIHEFQKIYEEQDGEISNALTPRLINTELVDPIIWGWSEIGSVFHPQVPRFTSSSPSNVTIIVGKSIKIRSAGHMLDWHNGRLTL